MSKSQHMAFRRFGRSYHLRIETADDLERVLDLDDAHWVATSAPMPSINCDATFLDLLDANNTERIKSFEVRDAIRWLLDRLQDRSGITQSSKSLRLDAINTDDDEGQRIYASAKKILDRLNISDSEEITLDQVREIKAMVESTPISEAGVVLPEAAEDTNAQQFITDIINTVGGAPHPSNRPGVGRAQLDDFLQQAKAYIDWHTQGALPKDKTKSDIMPFGTQTPELFAIHASLCGKIDEYFAQCEVVAFDARTAGHVGRSDAELQSLDLSTAEAIESFIKTSPLAQPKSDSTLSLVEGINPYYSAELSHLRKNVMEPILGKDAAAISAIEWQIVKRLFAPHEAWVNAKSGAAVEGLGLEKLNTYLDDKFSSAVDTLIEQSTQTAFALDNIRLTEKLILFQAFLLDLANNFVSFPRLYDPDSRAMFEMGTLVMDGRRFSFATRVENRGEHSNIAKTGNMYLLYVEITSPQEGEKYEVAVPVTSGGKGNLCVGKRGVFRDVNGKESDARVLQIIENPISVSEALVSPFQRIGKLVGGKIESITTAAEKKLDTATSSAMQHVQAPPQPGQPSRGLMAGGLLMGGGVAIAAVGSAVAYMSQSISKHPYTIVLGIIIALLAVLLPISIVAMLKLRKRDLSAILEGSGWAINSRMRLTVRQSRYFSQRPQFPKSATGVPRTRAWVVVLAVIIALGIIVGWYLNRPKQKDAEPSKIEEAETLEPAVEEPLDTTPLPETIDGAPVQ